MTVQHDELVSHLIVHQVDKKYCPRIHYLFTLMMMVRFLMKVVVMMMNNSSFAMAHPH